MTDLLTFTPIEFIKIYIGQLPLELEEYQLTEILQPMAELKEVKIIKGDNSRGRYELFCYAFVTMKGNEAFGLDIIRQLQERFPTWKMNLKNDYDRQRIPVNMRNYHNNMVYGPPLPHYQPYPPMHVMPYPTYFANDSIPLSNVSIPSSEKIVGQKPCNVLVRQLWLGGIPQYCDKTYISQVMSYYGIIEEIEMFPKFAFVKYKQVSEATTAFERAEEIFEKLGSPPGFRIYFSDPARRAFVVSNNYEYDRQSPSLPILYIGFPPITSANVEMQIIKPICENYGPIVNEYLRRNNNNQNRSYFLFTFDTVRNALRAKVLLSKRKDLLGDKRAEVTLLLDQQVIMKGHDLTRTEKLFQNDDRKKNLGYFGDNSMRNSMIPMQMGNPMYPNMYPPNPYMPPYYQQYPSYYYDPNCYNASIGQGQMFINQEQSNTTQLNNNIQQFLKEVLVDKNNGGDRKPTKNGEVGKEDDILRELLGQTVTTQKKNEQNGQKIEEKQQEKQREPSWSGFLTWKGLKRIGVDGHSKTVQPQDYSINILSLIEFNDLALKQRKTMVLQSSNSTGSTVFNDYIRQLKSRAGVAMNKNFLMYVMGKTQYSDQIQSINQSELLVVLEKASFLTLIKDKLIKCQELQSQ